MPENAALLPGTLDLLTLEAVWLGRLHGYGVLLRIEQISGGALQILQGALYPALYRLDHQGLIGERVGRLGKRPSRQVLPSQCRRTAAPRRRGCEMETNGRCHFDGAAGHSTGGLR